MVSTKISNTCYPINVKMGKEMRDGTLVLNVTHGKEVEVEYSKNEIQEKINSFFGYKCISNIQLKIVREKINNEKKILSKIKNFDKIEKKINKVNNSQLKNSLNQFLKAYNERNK